MAYLRLTKIHDTSLIIYMIINFMYVPGAVVIKANMSLNIVIVVSDYLCIQNLSLINAILWH